MVRRTKADALVTRNTLLDAAEHLFQAHGVSRTSLNDIATAAGTTRGAIYWHFKDKADLFNAMMERVTMPLEATLASAAENASSTREPLEGLRHSMMNALRQTAQHAQTRRVFEVATHKGEYVTEMQAVRDRHLRVRNECMAMTRAALQAGAMGASISGAGPSVFAWCESRSDAEHAAQITQMAALSDPATVGAVIAELLTTDLRSEVHKIQQPVLLLGAGGALPSAAMRPAVQALYQQQIDTIPQAKLDFNWQARHFIMLDQPDWLAARIARALKD